MDKELIERITLEAVDAVPCALNQLGHCCVQERGESMSDKALHDLNRLLIPKGDGKYLAFVMDTGAEAKGLAVTLNQYTTALRAANEALAATIQQLRDGISTCISYKCQPSKELLRVGYDTAAILAERDARTLRMAADLRNSDDVLAPVGNSAYGEAYQEGWIAGTEAFHAALRARADELAKDGATEKQP